MNRLVLALAAIATLAGPLTVATDASAQPRRGYDRHYDHRDYGRHYAPPPPRAYYNYAPRYGYGYGYAPAYAWRRGGYLPPNYGGVYISNYGAYGLRAPPRGYRWSRYGNDYLLTAIATGLIFDIVTR
jgi:Ni/Co efflux regulator RcnB